MIDGGIRAAFAALLVSCLAACGPGGAAAPGSTIAPLTPAPSDYERPAVRFGQRVVSVEIADEPFERQRGLMYRTRLAPDAGMLFVFGYAANTGFWMKNTKIPLSIAFMRHLGRGRFEVVRILDMEPCRAADASDCPRYRPGSPYDAALEVNRGWFVRAGVDEGDVATLEPGP